MERLTDRTGAGMAIMKAEYSSDQICKSAMRQQVIERLAAYEETGLAPKDIPHGLELAEAYSAICLLKQYEAIGTLSDLTDLVKARDEGRVVVLPCARNGAELYFADAFRGELYKEAYTAGLGLFWTNDSDIGDCVPLSCIGKTVFLTRAEEEAALKGENDGDS